MSDAGLTNGAFYANFASKEDLVATTVARPATRTAREFSARCARPRRS
jgi:TetR/AcrR family transcriptional regulator, transcriptional repressor for nem operon